MSTLKMAKKILVVGLLCVDVVNYTDTYPLEDTDQNCREQILTTGGNAANNCKVFKQLGCDECILYSSFGSAEDWASQAAECQMVALSIDITRCPRRSSGSLSLSVIIVNDKTGSRTILHHKKGLLEPLFDEFRNEFNDLLDLAWVHFEGRNVTEVRQMIDYILNWRKVNKSSTPTISVELEKVKPDLKELAIGADYVFIGKDFAKSLSFNDMTKAVENLSKVFHGSNVFCAWGDQGACVMTKEMELYKCPAMAPGRIIDTLGAGDTFIASCISQLVQNSDCQTALTFGCRMAGAKCCIKGFMGLGNVT